MVWAQLGDQSRRRQCTTWRIIKHSQPNFDMFYTIMILFKPMTVQKSALDTITGTKERTSNIWHQGVHRQYCCFYVKGIVRPGTIQSQISSITHHVICCICYRSHRQRRKSITFFSPAFYSCRITSTYKAVKCWWESVGRILMCALHLQQSSNSSTIALLSWIQKIYTT